MIGSNAPMNPNATHSQPSAIQPQRETRLRWDRGGVDDIATTLSRTTGWR
ncbi:hypothetical protein ACVOMT_02225 [Sphingomonas panni]